MTDILLPEDIPPHSPVEFRAAQTVEVRWKDRVISVIAVPWDQEAHIWHQDKLIRESFAPGSFDGIERRAGRVKVHRDHPPHPSTGLRPAPVGRAVTLHPSRTEGLVADMRISPTPLGDETLALAEDDVLDASVGFAVMPDGEEWLDKRSHRRITKAFLDHIAMVPDPAYEGARVLAVRSSWGEELAAKPPRVPTPNLDAWRLQRLLAETSSRM